MPELSRYLTVDRLQAEGDRWSVRTAIAATTAQASKTLIQVGTVLLLARLIVPEAFGAVAMVVAVIAVFELLRDFAVSTVVVGRDDVTQSEMSNLFWVTVGLSGACSAHGSPALRPRRWQSGWGSASSCRVCRRNMSRSCEAGCGSPLSRSPNWRRAPSVPALPLSLR